MFESSANLAGAITFGPTTHVQTILEKKTLKKSARYFYQTILKLKTNLQIKNQYVNLIPLTALSGEFLYF
jgi:hypothetical protein